MHDRIRLGITHGDINGIGYEVIIKTLQDNRVYDSCIPIVYGSPKVAAYHRKAINVQNFSFNNIRNAGEASEKRANIINVVDEEIRVELGKPSQVAGEAAFESLRAAVHDLKTGQIDLLLTAPINKFTIRSDQFPYPGHTEYLEAEFGAESMMLMISEVMRVGLVTSHIPLSRVSETITPELILRKLRIMNHSLKRDFMIRKPRIAVLGLNPHAGDEGVLGNEEQEVILPAVQQAKEEQLLAFGPFPADGFFGSGSFRKFDAVLAMYHDQGLVPFKSIVFDQGVNYTAGLDIIRTSPAHGTAFDIAGSDQASPDSFRNALYLACDLYRNRKLFDEISANPLSGGSASDQDEDQSPPPEE